ncbi:hypothetical protein PIB30_044760 [Stylosanthes scabra]|uniref:Uncharacterized protein n=1 Tax=Stylosanthes scabra TaxID=79078 RepID=A0ABU6QFB9_9FABA|nr:hypothetical protein [Stylosanthes scabra]
MVRKESDEGDKEDPEDDWLYELLSELAKLNDSNEEEESEEEDNEEEEDMGEEEMEEEDVGDTFFIATMLGGNKVVKEEIPPKCTDPRPSLVTCKIRGGIRVASLKYCSEDPFLKTASFRLDYIDGTFTFKVGNITEIFPPPRPTAPWKKSAQEMQVYNDEVRRNNALIKGEEKRIENPKDKIKEEKGLRNTPPQVKKKKMKERVKPIKKKRKHEEGSLKKKIEEDKTRKNVELKCSNVDDLISKLKAFKGALHNNKSLDTHLVKDHYKWK